MFQGRDGTRKNSKGGVIHARSRFSVHQGERLIPAKCEHSQHKGFLSIELTPDRLGSDLAVDVSTIRDVAHYQMVAQYETLVIEIRSVFHRNGIDSRSWRRLNAPELHRLAAVRTPSRAFSDQSASYPAALK